ncbi:MAG: transporter [Schleiferiaceae bacterium]|nr:transporter [Schleiferiaceae bacterium]
MKKISIVILMASSFWGMAQERPELEEIVDPAGPHTPVILMPSIATDRPDITESAQITPVGWFQYEGGYQYSHGEESLPGGSITDRHQFEKVVRFGINQRFEVRAVINANTERIAQQSTWINPIQRITGISPVTFGFKYNLIKESDVLPQTTWLSHITLPWIAGGDYRAPSQGNVVFHEQRLMLEKGLTSRLGIASNIGISGGMSGSNGFVDGGMFSLALGYDLGKDFGVYVEYFSNWQVQGQQLFGTPYFDGGFTKLLSNDLQLDVYAGFDLSPYVTTQLNTSGLFFGTGVSYRLPLAQHLR